MASLIPRSKAPGWPFYSVAVLAAAAAFATQVHLPLLLRAPLGFLLLGVFPGWLLAESLLRSERTTAEERAMASLALSVPVTILGRTLGFMAGLPAPAFLWAWAGLCTIWALLLRPRARPGAPADRVAWLIVGALALLVALPPGLDLVTRTSGDAISHVQIIEEIRLRGLPPQDPAYAGMPLTYMWQFHVWAAALVEGMGLTPFGIFPWVGGAMVAVLGFGAHCMAALFWTERRYRRLAPAVVALGMNALGWVLMATRLVVGPLVGHDRGLADFYQQFSTLVLHPRAFQVCGAIIYQSSFVLCSMLYKFLSACTLGTALSLIVATFALVAVQLREGGRGRLVAIAVLAMSAVVVHPVVGLPAGVALCVGLALAALTVEGRRVAIGPALAVVAGTGIGFGIIWFTQHLDQMAGHPVRVRLMVENIPPVVQGLSVVILPALWGWAAVYRRSKALALFGLGFGMVCLATSLGLSPPMPRTPQAYLVYLAYMGIAFFAPAGIGALVDVATRRIGRRWAWTLAALVFLPNALLLFNGWARQDGAWGYAGYPETRDDFAVFDYARDRTPVDAVFIDLQWVSCSAAAGYSGRRILFGGRDSTISALIGHPLDVVAARERVVVNLLLEPGVSDSTWRALRDQPAPVYVVARRTPTPYMLVPFPPGPHVDAIAKLDALPQSFIAVVRTPSLVLYRFQRGSQTSRRAREDGGPAALALPRRRDAPARRIQSADHGRP